MRIRAVIEFDLTFSDDIPSIEELTAYHNANLNESIALEIKNLLEDEHRGLAEYDSAVVSVREVLV
jgi:hypothetical protein